ncbi:scavenger receptor class F member 1-like [Rhineura floridana]|uniref:scavenger receptor class F member 1-like n=1 Tax=Rhineura floridana TaxID=261503 RepID=UPI002AC88689|nr:scavenger receptor class F member 1-like [Rhineura floridana]
MDAPPERRAPLPTSEQVYRLAGALGSELQRLSGLFGPSAVAGLVPEVVRLLELLEALAAAGEGGVGGPDPAEGLCRAGQLQEGPSAGEPFPGPTRDFVQALELQLAEARQRERLLQSGLAQAEEENQRLLAQLAGSQSQEDSALRKERDVMLRLKEVVDRQRDKLRAQAHEILCKARDTEALQEQLNRFMSMNEELRHKLAVVQAQLRSALEKKGDLENALLETRQEAERLSKAGAAAKPLRTSTTDEEVTAAAAPPGEGLPGRGQRDSSFSKEELQQVLQERNELKTSLFLVQEELAYYQRELLSDERIPSLLLEAVKSTIKKQRKKIWAKMLGTAEEPMSSDEEEEGVWLTSPAGSDCLDGRLPESKIKSLFSLWYRRSSKSSSPEAWEIVGPQDVGPEEQEEETRASCSSSPSDGPSHFPCSQFASSGKTKEEMGGRAAAPEGGLQQCRGCSSPGNEFLPGIPTRRMARWPLLLFCLQFLGPGIGSCSSDLDPSGRHVCTSDSHPPVLTCCPGWKQEGRECPAALCTGADACREGEVCIRPGVCRCRPGFFGADCIARCPDHYWGPDCKESCLCYPNGKCDPVSGECSCHPGRWGPLCQFACLCGPRSHCDPLTGACQCEPGWWAPDCRRPCSCNLSGSRCDPVTGRCLCRQGWWGKRCTSSCLCNGSPCAQETGRCECREGLWGVACQSKCQCLHGTCAPQDGQCTCDAGYQGQSCRDPCPPRTYGLRCAHSCGHCKHQEPCSPVTGSCLACEPGWNGTHCKQLCPPGRHGENCTQICPRCRRGETCHPETGKCRNCEAGLTGARCELSCPTGLFGEGCQFTCPDCVNGSCDPVSGACVCQAGFWGTSCNQTCPAGFHGLNCSEPCQCVGGTCHPISGDCQGRGQNQAALLAGILTPLILLFLILLCMCCCCCRPAPMDTRAVAAEGDPISRVKHHVLGALASASPALPCFSLGGYKLPRVTVSHHDAELPFNPSFIEPLSAAWPSDSSFSSSFDTDDEEGGAASPLPASKAPDAELAAGFPPGALALNSEPFAIPRTSSIAKAKQPSVSFAEGTRFSSQSPRGSMETLDPTRKPKAPWGSAQVSSPQCPQTDQAGAAQDGDSPGSCYENVEALCREDGSHKPSTQKSTPGGHGRKRMASSRHVAQRVEALEAASRAQGKDLSVTTIYVTVGKAGSEGPVQAVLQRLGSLQRAKQLSGKESLRARSSPQGIQKPPWRALGSERDTAVKLMPQDKAGLEASMPCTETSAAEEAEAQGILGGPAVPTGEHGSLESPQSHNQPEMLTGGAALEENAKEELEPKYENVSGWSSSP